MTDTIQVALSISLPALAVLAGILIDYSRLSDPRAQIDGCFGPWIGGSTL